MQKAPREVEHESGNRRLRKLGWNNNGTGAPVNAHPTTIRCTTVAPFLFTETVIELSAICNAKKQIIQINLNVQKHIFEYIRKCTKCVQHTVYAVRVRYRNIHVCVQA